MSSAEFSNPDTAGSRLRVAYQVALRILCCQCYVYSVLDIYILDSAYVTFFVVVVLMELISIDMDECSNIRGFVGHTVSQLQRKPTQIVKQCRVNNLILLLR